MTFLITICEIENNRYSTNEYAIKKLYFYDTKNDKFVIAKIIREIHLVDKLKVNMLIDNDLLKSKNVVINVVNKTIFITIYNVFIDIEI